MLFRFFTVLAVAALIIITWYKSSPSHRPSSDTTGKRADLPGYYLKNTVLTDYDDAGAPSIRIEAERIDQIGQSNEVQLYHVKVNYEAPGGQNWALFGDTAHVQPGGKTVDVSGNVRLQEDTSGRTGTAVIRSDTMSYDVAESIASTKSDVRIEYAGHILTARGLTANLKARTIHLEQKVNGRFFP